jgi:gluconolactonase
VTPEGKIEVVADIGGGPNGAAIGPDGAVYIANNGGFVWRDSPDGHHHPTGEAPDDYTTGRIERVDLATGEVTRLYDSCGGYNLRGPNDLVFDANGDIWFTDTGKNRKRDIDHGGLYFAKSDGSFIAEIAYPLITPNGVGLSPDGKTVYVAETLSGRMWSWQITGPGTVATDATGAPARTLVLGLPGMQFLDSLAVEADGRVAVATLVNGGITVVNPDGTGIEHTPTGDPTTTNIAFGGPDMKTAYITLSSTGRLVSMDWPRPGLRLNY